MRSSIRTQLPLTLQLSLALTHLPPSTDLLTNELPLSVCLAGWLTGWLMEWMVDLLVDRPAGWLTGSAGQGLFAIIEQRIMAELPLIRESHTPNRE